MPLLIIFLTILIDMIGFGMLFCCHYGLNMPNLSPEMSLHTLRNIIEHMLPLLIRLPAVV